MPNPARPICGRTDCRSGWRLECRTWGFEFEGRPGFEVLRCPDCDLGFTEPVPSEEAAEALYRARDSAQFHESALPLARTLRDFQARRRMKRLGKALGGAPRAIWDYGCGDGTYALAGASAFPEARVTASDYGDEPPPRLARAGGDYRSFQSMERDGGLFDLILCRHVLEHAHRPERMLSSLAGRLAPGGALWLEVPSLDSNFVRWFAGYWDALYAPFHILHFTARALRELLERSGFRVQEEGRTHTPAIGRSLGHRFGLPFGPALFGIGLALYPLQALADAFGGRSSVLTVLARRPA